MMLAYCGKILAVCILVAELLVMGLVIALEWVMTPGEMSVRPVPDGRGTIEVATEAEEVSIRDLAGSPRLGRDREDSSVNVATLFLPVHNEPDEGELQHEVRAYFWKSRRFALSRGGFLKLPNNQYVQIKNFREIMQLTSEDDSEQGMLIEVRFVRGAGQAGLVIRPFCNTLFWLSEYVDGESMTISSLVIGTSVVVLLLGAIGGAIGWAVKKRRT